LTEETVNLTKGYDVVCGFTNDNINKETIDIMAENGIKLLAMRCAGFNNVSLKDINGHPMIEWVYKRAENAAVNKLVVATDDQRIYDAVKKFGGNVVMTSKEHENGTSRIIEVINNPEYSDFDFVINIQGDEPLIDIKSINLLANNYREEKSEIVA